MSTDYIPPMRLVKREEAPDYLRKPWIHKGYLVGKSQAAVKCETLPVLVLLLWMPMLSGKDAFWIVVTCLPQLEVGKCLIVIQSYLSGHMRHQEK